jgi:hypothetical protein
MRDTNTNEENRALELIKSDEPLIDPPTSSGDLEESGVPKPSRDESV